MQDSERVGRIGGRAWAGGRRLSSADGGREAGLKNQTANSTGGV